MRTLSGPDVAEWAGLSVDQLDYFRRIGLVTTDVGGTRKRWSIAEARLVVVAASAVTFGLDPKVLIEPIKWLREFVSWPSIELPDNPASVEIELISQRLSALPESDVCRAEKIRHLAASILESNRAPSLRETHPVENYEAALRSSDEPLRGRAEAARAHADKLLDRPKWPIDLLKKVESANNFEIACRGSADLFFHVSAGEDSWSTFVSKDAGRVENETTWLVIDIRRLFSQRRPML